MKICFVTYDVFTLGGIQRVVSVMANEISKEHEVYILCMNSMCVEDREKYGLDKNINVVYGKDKFENTILEKVYSKIIKKINKKNGIFNKDNCKFVEQAYYNNRIQNKVIRYLNQMNFDIVIGVSGEYSLLLGMIANKIKAKTIGWQHNSFEAYFKTQGTYFWNEKVIFKKYLKNLDEYIVLTNHDKKYMEEYFKIKCTRIYNPLSFESKIKSKGTNKIILFVGRLAKEQKGIDLLIESFEKIHMRCEEWKLKIVGDGEDKEEIEKIIKNKKLENKIIIEEAKNDIKKEYINASIFVSSSRWEGFGLVVTEAMECGLPVIAFNNSGPREIISSDNENGVLVKKYDVEKLSENILRLIENKILREKIAKKSINRAKDFSKERIAKEWNFIFKDERFMKVKK